MILHIDMDAFYASVEEREQPALRGRPLAGGGSPGARGVIAAANYAARKFGVHSALPSALALRRCPSLILLQPRGKLYAQVGAQIREIFHRYTPLVEPLSLDEAFLDPRGSERLHGGAEKIGKNIKRDILRELKLVASVGVAPNKFLAKLASGHEKPDGFTVITTSGAQQFLDALPVEKMWGVGKSARARLHDSGIYTTLQLRKTKPEFLTKEFGSHGERLWQLAHGIDARAVVAESEAKSISHETTFADDITAPEILQAVAMDLSESVCYRLRRAGARGRTVTLKIRYEDFSTKTRARSLSEPTDATNVVWQLADKLLQTELARAKRAVRLLGIGVSNFGDADAQKDLFGIAARGKLDALSDEIKSRYGKEMIRRGKGIL